MTRKRNLIELKDGIIFFTQAGDQTREIAMHSVNAISLLAADLPEVKILVDYSESGKIDPAAMKAGFHAMKSIDFDKVAIYGASPYMTNLINGMARAVGKSKIIRFSKTREEALEWLKK